MSMKKPLLLFLFSLVVITALISVNRWDVPVMIWLGTVFGVVAFVSGIACLYILIG